MAYCTVAELADALHTRVTDENASFLQLCVDAAAKELDDYLDRPDTADSLAGDPLANRDNVFRAVQWFKVNDVAAGGGGYTETGLLQAPTRSWTPMSWSEKQQWGIA